MTVDAYLAAMAEHRIERGCLQSGFPPVGADIGAVGWEHFVEDRESRRQTGEPYTPASASEGFPEMR
jgi:hypothetical protein